jgi:hypothetical protein
MSSSLRAFFVLQVWSYLSIVDVANPKSAKKKAKDKDKLSKEADKHHKISMPEFKPSSAKVWTAPFL